jgi:hypothetical protein
MKGSLSAMVGLGIASNNMLDERELVEVGLGAPVNLEVFDEYVDSYRLLFHLRRGRPYNGYDGLRDVYDMHISPRVTFDEFQSMALARGALLLFRAFHDRRY